MGRSIPACAGEPVAAPIRSPPTGVYPRVCGGTITTIEASKSIRGLSPACAGEPSLEQVCAVLQEVYPRVCGGTVRAAYSGLIGRGLSPRVRGNHPYRSCP